VETGERIRKLRKSISLTQKIFANRIGVSTSYVAGIESGNKKISKRIVRLISVEFNVDEHWIYTGEGEMYYDKASANLSQITGLFKSLSPPYQECALIQIKAIADLYYTSNTLS